MPQLTGTEFEHWLFDPEHRTLPDFLNMPEVAFGAQMQQSDLKALRALAINRGEQIPTHHLAGIVRLHAHGIIDRRTTEHGAMYFLTAYSYEVLLHNVSYRGRS